MIESVPSPKSPALRKPTPESATRVVFQEMLSNIQNGRWAVGTVIPSERTLIGDFGVSRIAIREALSMLKGLGVLDVQHGRRTRVRTVGSEAIGHLLPMMLDSGTQKTLDHVFDARLALESRTAYLAAERWTDADMEELRELVACHRRLSRLGESKAVAVDLKFHLAIARITGNPLYPILLEALAGFIVLTQKESCKDDPMRRRRAVLSHEAILDALSARNPEWARSEMKSHLLYSATRQVDESDDA